jgi:hypothetical protein
MKLKYFSPLFFFLLFSCSDESTIGPTFTDTNPEDVELRIKNESGFVLNNIKITNRSLSKNYGNLLKNKDTEYKSFSKADTYFGVEFIVSNYLFEYIPDKTDDFMKEGFYSISIYRVDTARQTFTFLLEEEN